MFRCINTGIRGEASFHGFAVADREQGDGTVINDQNALLTRQFCPQDL